MQRKEKAKRVVIFTRKKKKPEIVKLQPNIESGVVKYKEGSAESQTPSVSLGSERLY